MPGARVVQKTRYIGNLLTLNKKVYKRILNKEEVPDLVVAAQDPVLVQDPWNGEVRKGWGQEGGTKQS